MAHTIVLIQVDRSTNSRTYADYNTLQAATEGIVSMYEAHLKATNKQAAQITYDVTDLHRFLDSLGDISCLTLQGGGYKPYSRADIKSMVFDHLKRMAAPAAGPRGGRR